MKIFPVLLNIKRTFSYTIDTNFISNTILANKNNKTFLKYDFFQIQKASDTMFLKIQKSLSSSYFFKNKNEQKVFQKLEIQTD